MFFFALVASFQWTAFPDEAVARIPGGFSDKGLANACAQRKSPLCCSPAFKSEKGIIQFMPSKFADLLVGNVGASDEILFVTCIMPSQQNG